MNTVKKEFGALAQEVKDLRPVFVPMVCFLLGVVSSISYMSYAHMHEEILSLPKTEWQCGVVTNVDTGMPNFVRDVFTVSDSYKRAEKTECISYIRRSL